MKHENSDKNMHLLAVRFFDKQPVGRLINRLSFDMKQAAWLFEIAWMVETETVEFSMPKGGAIMCIHLSAYVGGNIDQRMSFGTLGL